MKRSMSIVFLVLLTVPGTATLGLSDTLTRTIVDGPADFFFDPALGRLSALWLSYDYSTWAFYSCFAGGATLAPLYAPVTWFDRATLEVYGDYFRTFGFDWTVHGFARKDTDIATFEIRGESGLRALTYHGAGIPAFFISGGPGADVRVHPTESFQGMPFIFPEVLSDSNGNRYIVEITGVRINQLTVTYLYDTPEPSSLALVLAGLAGLACIAARRVWVATRR